MIPQHFSLCLYFLEFKKKVDLFWTLQGNKVRDVLFLLFLREMLYDKIFGNLLCFSRGICSLLCKACLGPGEEVVLWK